ncbi:gluconokinase [Pelagicoccus albus]|uniref:Gluconokinase n=2 Tax=Pelagicoccus albus TaxID=415222 RepID=A0A7X1E728_9BACT|nr:gluconokinase [Pelagicoccus albus]MBC2604894.1 gluconokinase [Pelagicoccus albus]
MGVSGSGKSTIAHALADALRIEMLDADDFHPPENVAKMAAGRALNDEDRAGWLRRLNEELEIRLNRQQSVVLACSALKEAYRVVLQDGLEHYRWIYLKGDRSILAKRIGNREDHFMPESLLDSQLETLEEPTNALILDIRKSKEEILQSILESL